MSALEDAKPVHARWSEENRRFLEFLETHPEGMDRGSYAPVYQAPRLQSFPSVQPWPLFFEPPRLRELAEMAVGMDGVMKAAIERFLQNDVEVIAKYYHTAPGMDGSPGRSGLITEDTVPILVAEPSGVSSAFSRADYLDTPDGLKFMEFNSGGFIGGLHTDHLCELYLQSPPIARFLRDVNRRAAPMGILRAMFRHLVDDCKRLEVWTGGDFNVAMIIRPNPPEVIAEHDEAEYTRELRAALAQAGHAPGGRVFLCALEELDAGWDGVALDGQPVHAVIEQHDGDSDIRPVFRAFKAGRVDLFSGPIKGILTDKRNMALVSEHAESDDFTAAERALIQRHMPWTRRVLPSSTPFRGRPLRLPDDLAARRDDFVLKKGWSWGGDHVVVGRFRTQDEWEKAIARAVWEGDWVVQERLDTLPYCFHSAQAGAVRHELVWGLFVFGRHFGGVHLRMQPTGRGGGVVNTNQGADLGAGLALVD